MLSSHLHVLLLSSLFLSDSATTTLHDFLFFFVLVTRSVRFVPYDLRPQYDLARNTNFEVPHLAVSSIILLTPNCPCWLPSIILNTQFLEALNPCPALMLEAKFHTHTKQQAKLQFIVFGCYVFPLQTGRHNSMDRTVTGMP
jgi:hypothetical protein